MIKYKPSSAKQLAINIARIFSHAFYCAFTALLPLTLSAAETQLTDCRQVSDTAQRLQCYESRDPLNNHLTNTVLDERLQQEQSTLDNSFSFTAHRPTYILPLTYMDTPNTEPFSATDVPLENGAEMDNLEAKFQISFRVPIINNFLIKNSQLWFAYTQLSLWQLYNRDNSSPFRETNHEPEIIWSFLINRGFGEVKLTHLSVGLNHQSNGQSEPLSRSWNRLFLSSVLTYEHWVLEFRPWYRLPELSGEDDNPDIEDYMGHFDLRLGQKKQEHQLSTLLRGTVSDGKLRAFYEIGYSFSINRKFRAYVQYVSGYGESLIDYNHRNQRLSVGIMLNDWF
jgi:phospholipase A1